MLGSIFIHEMNPERLRVLIDKPEALEEFEYIEMSQLLTLDFELALSGSGRRWTSKEPAALQEEDGSGKVVVQVLPDALRYALSNPDRFNQDTLDDLQLLRNLTNHFGFENIYEYSCW